MTNDKRAAQLGMPWGTAQNQLRKQVLFKMAKKAGEAICYRCKKDIQTAEELSIEHIKPWLDVSAELFWDLENIAFSHRDCNRPHRYREMECDHGLTRYQHWGCRCDICRAAKAEKRARWKNRAGEAHEEVHRLGKAEAAGSNPTTSST